MTIEVEEIMTIDQVASLLGRTPAAVRNLTYRRKIPYRKPAGRLIFLRSEVESWISNAPGLSLEQIRAEAEHECRG